VTYDGVPRASGAVQICASKSCKSSLYSFTATFGAPRAGNLAPEFRP